MKSPVLIQKNSQPVKKSRAARAPRFAAWIYHALPHALRSHPRFCRPTVHASRSKEPPGKRKGPISYGSRSPVAISSKSRAAAASLQGIILHRRHKSRQALPFRRPFHLHPHQVLAFRSRFPQHHERAQRLVIHPGHQKRVPGLLFLPKLPYLNFPCAHILAIDSMYPAPPLSTVQNSSATANFLISLGNLPYPFYILEQSESLYRAWVYTLFWTREVGIMRKSSQFLLALLFAASFVSWPVVASAQNQSSNPPSQAQTQPQAGQSQTPDQSQSASPIPLSKQPPPPPPAPDKTTPAPAPAPQPAATADAPVDQSKTVHPKNSKEDVDAIGNRNVGKGINFYSLEREIALGKALAQEVERSSKLIDDPVVTEYVNRVGQNLVRNSDAQVPFTIKVIDSDEVNAFALPGGFFYVNSGLILRAQEESELAGVMAHEISHVTARHGTKQATKGEIIQMATIPLMLLGPVGWAGYGIYEGLNIAIPLTYLKFSRDSEREADFLGLEYMYKAGYDPNAFVTFFERIQADEKRRPGTIPKVFSTHPPTPDRIEAAQKEIARILPNKPEYIVTTSEFDSVKGRLRNIMFARKVQDNQPGKPSLRTRTEQQQKGTQQQDPNANPDDDRPTLKRRPDDSQ